MRREKSNRMRRVDEMLHREIGTLCERDIAPEMTDALVTVTHVDTSTDLRHAVVHVSVMGDARQEKRAFELLRRKRARFQHEIAQHTTLRYTPVLTFRLDTTFADADRVFAIIDELDLSDTVKDGSD